jgi:IS605 OrfB family transposase
MISFIIIMDEEEDNKTKTKAQVIFSHFTDQELDILHFMTSISKNIYNTTIYCSQIFFRYKSKIFQEVYDTVLAGRIKNIDQCDSKIMTVYQKYFNHYTNIKQHLITNNNFIYNFIRDKLNGFYITDFSYEFYKTHFEIVLRDKVTYSRDTKQELFLDIIERIMKSYYVRNYCDVKNKIRNRQKIINVDEFFIDHVKQDKFLFKQPKPPDIKKKILDHLINTYGEAKIAKKVAKKKEKRKTLLTDQSIVKFMVLDHLGDNKDKLGNDLIGNVISKAFKGFSSYFAKKAKGMRCNFPKFLPKNSIYNLVFSMAKSKIEDGKARISLGKYVGENYIEITKSSQLVCLQKGNKPLYVDKTKLKTKNNGQKIHKKDNYIVDEKQYIEKNNETIIHDVNYLYLKIPPKLQDKKISQIEIVPLYNGHRFKACFSYRYDIDNCTVTDDSDIKYDDCISIDLGIRNLMTIHDPTGRQKIISGRFVNNVNHYYNDKIDRLKSAIKRCQKKDTSKRIRDSFIKRENVIDNYFNNLVSWLVNAYSHKKLVIVGYNKQWKNGVKMGKKNNRDFYNIPYAKLLNKLRFQLTSRGIRFEEIEESYTSKCDALALEVIGKHEEYLGERYGKHKRLFKSSNGDVIHADLNGAINIMRKYFSKINKQIIFIEGKQIHNPLRTNVFKPARVKRIRMIAS